MKVLLVNTFHHRRGGDATYSLSLLDLLRAHGHTVVPLAMRHPDNQPSTWERWFVPWVDYRDLVGAREHLGALRRFAFNPDARKAAATLLDRVRPDVVHLQHVHHHLTPSVVEPARKRGIPVVWTVHDYELICPNGLLFTGGRPCEACRGHRYHQAIRRRCKRGSLGRSTLAAVESSLHAASRLWHRVDRFLCPSAFLADRLVSFGVPSHRVHHLPNFVEVDAGSPPPIGRGWVYAGRLAEEKGLHTLLDAAALLPDHRLTICGAGPLESLVRARAVELPWVRTTGHVPATELAGILGDSAAVAVPSIWYENFPYAVLEGQVLARGVVASRIGGIPEQITHGVDGLLVPPGDPVALADALRPLLEDPARARALGLAARARVAADLTPAAHYRALLEHYEAVTA